jgi:2-phosphosulfolactate phosphatase
VGALRERRWISCSPEARAAEAAWAFLAADVPSALSESASGRELTELGYPSDVEIAAEVDTSRTVPLLCGHQFLDASN